MGLQVNIHASGGYDVVETVDGEEGDMVEYVGFALSPFELETIASRFLKAGAIVTDHRSAEKLALADDARNSARHWRELALRASGGGIEPEAIAKAKLYADRCHSLAVESCC